MKVLLVSPVSRILNHYRPPLALINISGYLKYNGVDCKIIDQYLKEQVRDKKFLRSKENILKEYRQNLITEILSNDPSCVGITCYSTEVGEVIELAEAIKRVNSNIKIVVGGIHPTLYPNNLLNASSPIDFIIRGDGEVTFLELINCLKTKIDPYKVESIGFYDLEKNTVIQTNQRETNYTLDDISIPDYSDLNMEYYTTASPYSIRGVFVRSFYISSSRGCPSSCTFCVAKKIRLLEDKTKAVRLRTPEKVFEEVQLLNGKFHIDSFYFIDDLFTLKKDNVYRFCDLMIKSKIRLVWGCSSKINTVDYEMLRIMKLAGCIQIDFGVEKGSDEALKSLKKGINIKRIKEVFYHCHKLGIRTFANMLINSPNETEQDLSDSLNLLDEIKPNIVSFNPFTPYPGCEIADECLSGIKLDRFQIFNNSIYKLIKEHPEQFKLSSHNIDIEVWSRNMMKKYNKVLPNITIFFNVRYLFALFTSKRKLDYFKQLFSLFREFVNQKLG